MSKFITKYGKFNDFSSAYIYVWDKSVVFHSYDNTLHSVS